MSRPHRTVLITGAGSGLGKGLSQSLALLGFPVIASDIDEAAATRTAGSIESGNCRPLRLDVTSESDVARAIDSLEGSQLDVLVNNAGLQHVAPLESFPQAQWDRLLDVMLRGTCLLTRAVLPIMRRQNFGRIINIGSVHSLVASPYKSAYVAAKHGLLGFSKVIALETADADITINTICPAYIRTPLVDKQIAAQALAHGIAEEEVIERIMLEPMPKKVFITAAEIAGTVEFLASDAARNITGQEIVIDGGWTAR